MDPQPPGSGHASEGDPTRILRATRPLPPLRRVAQPHSDQRARRKAGTTILSAWSAGPRALVGRVCLEAIGQFPGAAERGGVSAPDLIGRNAQAFSGDAPNEVGREQAVVAAEKQPYEDIGARHERGWL